MLMKRFDSETANGVRCVIKRNGMTGCDAQFFSTRMKRKVQMVLAVTSPKTTGCDQDISSVVLRLNARSKHPTAPTKVRDPK
jgi:hypothetical protein